MSDRDIGAMPDTQLESTPPAPPVTPPGALLAQRRQSLNMNVEQVANQLNLAPRQIQALEADNYGALPGMASVRGFIRAYAKLLKMDAEPLVQAIAQEATAARIEPLGPALSTTPFSDGRSRGPARFKSRWLLPALAAAGVILLMLAAQQTGWLTGLSKEFSLKIDTGPAISDSAAREPAPAEPPPPAEEAAPNAVPRTENRGGTSESALPSPSGLKPAAPAATVAPSPAVAPPAAAQPAAPAVAAGEALVLKMREDSWIDARRSDNTPLVSRLARAGETEVVKVTGPLSLTVGNAAGVDVTLRGKPVELQTLARSNVARVTLK